MNKTHYTFSHNYTDVTPIHISKACQTLRFEIMNASSKDKITPIFVAKCVSLLDVVNNYLKLNFLEAITESKILNSERRTLCGRRLALQLLARLRGRDLPSVFVHHFLQALG